MSLVRRLSSKTKGLKEKLSFKKKDDKPAEDFSDIAVSDQMEEPMDTETAEGAADEEETLLLEANEELIAQEIETESADPACESGPLVELEIEQNPHEDAMSISNLSKPGSVLPESTPAAVSNQVSSELQVTGCPGCLTLIVSGIVTGWNALWGPGVPSTRLSKSISPR